MYLLSFFFLFTCIQLSVISCSSCESSQEPNSLEQHAIDEYNTDIGGYIDVLNHEIDSLNNRISNLEETEEYLIEELTKEKVSLTVIRKKANTINEKLKDCKDDKCAKKVAIEIADFIKNNPRNFSPQKTITPPHADEEIAIPEKDYQSIIQEYDAKLKYYKKQLYTKDLDENERDATLLKMAETVDSLNLTIQKMKKERISRIPIDSFYKLQNQMAEVIRQNKILQTKLANTIPFNVIRSVFSVNTKNRLIAQKNNEYKHNLIENFNLDFCIKLDDNLERNDDELFFIKIVDPDSDIIGAKTESFERNGKKETETFSYSFSIPAKQRDSFVFKEKVHLDKYKRGKYILKLYSNRHGLMLQPITINVF